MTCENVYIKKEKKRSQFSKNIYDKYL